MFDPLTTAVAIDNPIPGDLDACEARLRSIARMRSWLSSRHAAVVARVALLEAARNPGTSEKRTRERVKENSGCTSGEARRQTEAAKQLGSMSDTRERLEQGRIPEANAHALARLRASLDGARRAAFDQQEAELARLAAEQSPDQFAKSLRDWAHQHADDDGADDARRLACEADLVPVVLGGSGQPLDVGRARRLATNAQRIALRTRYPGCAFAGCDRPFDWCHLHHLRPWNDGGRTDLDNLVPLCSLHHHLAHEGGWTPHRRPDGTVEFVKRTEQGVQPPEPAARPPDPGRAKARSGRDNAPIPASPATGATSTHRPVTGRPETSAFRRRGPTSDLRPARPPARRPTTGS